MTDAENADFGTEHVRLDEPAGPTPEDCDAGWLPLPAELKDAALTEKVVYIFLDELGEATAHDLIDASNLSVGGAYTALHQLRDRGLATRRPSLEGDGTFHWRLADSDIEPPQLASERSGGQS